MQINFKNVLLLSASPLVNFRLVNRFRFVHDENFPPIGELEHDVFFHGNFSHQYPKFSSELSLQYFKKRITAMNEFITLLYPSFNYNERDPLLYTEIESNDYSLVISPDEKQSNTREMTENQRKVCYCLILFEMIHETYRYKNVCAYIHNYLNRENIISFDDFIKYFNSDPTSQSKTDKYGKFFYFSKHAFSEENENKTVDTFKFLKHIDIPNVFINFIRLLFSLKTEIRRIFTELI